MALLRLAVWWVWIYTCWMTNWLDPERMPVRLCLFVLMLAGLRAVVLDPGRFRRTRARLCRRLRVHAGGAHAVLPVGRARGAVSLTRTFQRILVLDAAGGACWLAGGAPRTARFAWWALALSHRCVGARLYFWVPGLGRSSTADWNVEGSHMAERCALFVIIALGESLLVTGATFAELAWSPGRSLVSSSPWWAACDVVGLLRHGRRTGPPPHRAFRETPADWRAWPTRTCTC